MMLVQDCKCGDIVETVRGGVNSGNIYRISERALYDSSIWFVWKSPKQGKTILHADTEVRLVGLDEINLMGYEF